MSDERLAERVRAGDDAAFEVLYDRHHRQLLAFCRHMLSDLQEAEDVLQHVFVAAYRTMGADGPDLHVKAWLYAVARNRCLSVLRARRDAVELDEGVPSLDGLPAQVQRRADLQDLVADLQRLPEDQRAALVLAELGALSHDEVAEVLGVRRDKVKALVFQAREHLMQRREARLVPCREIQEQLATLRGGALRRSHLKRHVDECPPCAAFAAEVRRQRAAMAVLLPVVPGATVKAGVLGAALGGTGAGAAVVAGGAGAGMLAGAGAALEGVAAKVLLTAAVVGGTGAGGYAAVEGLQRDDGSRPAPAPQTRQDVPSGAASPVGSLPGGGLGRVSAPAPAPAPVGAPAARPAKTTSRSAKPAQAKRRPARRRRPQAAPPPAPAAAPVVVPAAAAPAVVQRSVADGRDDDRDERRRGRRNHDDARRGSAPAAAGPGTVVGRGDDDDDRGQAPKARRRAKAGPRQSRTRGRALRLRPAPAQRPAGGGEDRDADGERRAAPGGDPRPAAEPAPARDGEAHETGDGTPRQAGDDGGEGAAGGRDGDGDAGSGGGRGDRGRG
ncbi:MAG TPA: RNA polymerase sigma factor [Baekduia sp.]|nr:RNA polymerase sigma factor [Baekduia sp.]